VKKNSDKEFTYKWVVMGDLNAFFGLMLDNLNNMVIFTGIMLGIFGFPKEIVLYKMIPGTALGVLIGDLVYTAMAIKLAKKTLNPSVTAMPLGLDTPSTIGIAFAVLGPCFLAARATHNYMEAGYIAWHVGMAVMIFMGIVKVIMSFLGGWIRENVPQAGLLGSLAGIGLALLAFIPLIEIFNLPLVGLVSLGLIFYTLIAKIELPGKIPGAFAAIITGTAVYFILGPLGLLGESFRWPQCTFNLAFPMPTIGFWYGLKEAVKYIPIAVPFGILTIVGGINVTESARVAGDKFVTRDILLTEAIATLVAGLCGGVSQSTPYIGHPAYKEMGARAGYTLATGLFIGLGGMFGYIPLILQILPVAAVAPILIFIGFEIVTQAYVACPKRHFPAVTFAYLPIVADLVLIKMEGMLGDLQGALTKYLKELNIPNLPDIQLANIMPSALQQSYHTITALGHGFILTAMLWGAVLAFVIDRKLVKASIYLLITAMLTFFGFIHSVKPTGDIYLPWNVGSSTPYYFAGGYFLLALIFLLLSITPQAKTKKE